jgi:hypothetical protein
MRLEMALITWADASGESHWVPYKEAEERPDAPGIICHTTAFILSRGEEILRAAASVGSTGMVSDITEIPIHDVLAVESLGFFDAEGIP